MLVDPIEDSVDCRIRLAGSALYRQLAAKAFGYPDSHACDVHMISPQCGQPQRDLAYRQTARASL